MTAPALVDPDWLLARLADPDTVVLDATAALPGEAFDPAASFTDAHIPGAVPLDLDFFSDPDTALPHMIPSAGRFGRLAGSLGITADSTVVAYESRRLFAAARAWFLFRLHGTRNVHVLDGGLASWRDAGGPIQSGPARPRPPATYAPRLNASMLAGLGDIERLAGGQTTILDARSADRFAGVAPEPRPGLRSGHIPGSRNLPYGLLLDEAGRFHPPSRLQALFRELGVTAGQPVITSCGTGVTAAILLLGLVRAGIEDGRLFDGSWAEYALAHPASP